MAENSRVAVVTGGASGIGAAVCLRLARNGVDIAIWDLNEALMEEVAGEVRALGQRAITSKVDVSDRQAVRSAVARARQELGPVTIMVNSAGVHATGSITSMTDDEWSRVININLTGSFIVTQEVLPDMLDANWGRIVYISSSSTQTGSPNMAHYVASKGGVIGLAKALATELGPKGITVNNVPPGSVDTPMLRQLEAKGGLPGGAEAIGQRNPVRRLGTPEDMAAAVAFLASEEAGYITGHTLSANGGRYMN